MTQTGTQTTEAKSSGEIYVEITPPGIGTSKYRRRQPSTDLPLRLITEALSPGPLGRIGMKTIAMDADTKYYISGEALTGGEQSLESIDATASVVDSNKTVGNGIANLANIVSECLPSVFGVAVVSLNTQPLGWKPLPISHLYMTEQKGLPVNTTSTESPITRFTGRLDRRGTPFMLKTSIVKSNPGEYDCQLGLTAVEHTGRMISVDDCARHLAKGWIGDLADKYDAEHITSPRQLLTEAGLTGRKYSQGQSDASVYNLEFDGDSDDRAVAVEQLKQIREPTESYKWLRSTGGQIPQLGLTAQTDASPKLALTEEDLPAILGIIPGVSTPDQWSEFPGRNPPVAETKAVIREPAGAATESYGSGASMDNQTERGE